VDGQQANLAAGDDGPGSGAEAALTRGYLGACQTIRADFAHALEEAAARHPEDELLGGLADRYRAAVTVMEAAGVALLRASSPHLARLLAERTDHRLDGCSKLVS